MVSFSVEIKMDNHIFVLFFLWLRIRSSTLFSTFMLMYYYEYSNNYIAAT